MPSPKTTMSSSGMEKRFCISSMPRSLWTGSMSMVSALNHTWGRGPKGMSSFSALVQAMKIL